MAAMSVILNVQNAMDHLNLTALNAMNITT